MVVTGCGVDELDGDGCILGGGDGWVSEFWKSGIVCMLILTISMCTVCLTQFGQKVN